MIAFLLRFAKDGLKDLKCSFLKWRSIDIINYFG